MDEVRYEFFKNLTEAEDLAVSKPRNNKIALFTIVAGTLLMASVGAALMISSQQNQTTARLDTILPDEPIYSTFNVPVAPIPDSETANPGQTQSSASNQNQGTGEGLPDATTNNQGTVRDPSPPSGSGSRKYNPMTGEVLPFTPNVPSNITLIPDGGKLAQNELDQPGDDSEPEVTDNSTSNTTNSEPPKKDLGEAKITVLDKNHSTAGAEAIGDNSAESWITKARNFAARGQYGQAASAYEQALKQGASAASTNQRLAQCYERLGRRNDAINAYRRAIVAYDRMIATGSANPRMQASKNDCAQAIKQLGG